MMTGASNKSGGAAAAGGFDFQANIGAIACIHMLRGVPVRWTDGLTGAAPCAVSFETSGPGDDLALELADGSIVEMQVKKGLRGDSRFWSAVDALCEGIQSGRCSYGILIVCPNASDPVRRKYALALRRIGSGRFDDASPEQQKLASRLTANGYDPETTCARLRIRVVSALEDTGDAIAAARAELRHLCADDSQVPPTWNVLCQDSLSAITDRSRRTASDLLTRLRSSGIRLTGDRRYSSVRSKLAEDARHALEGIADRVGTVRLSREDHLAAIRRALDRSRYVEIRGEPGVGKSGLLKRLAEERSAKASVVVLSPGRVMDGGWAAMRASLGLQEGTARGLLEDIASSGDGFLFVDGLDSFSADERLTVVDLVREAAEVPGFSVLATTRRGFGGEDDEPEWLPSDTLDRLGRVTMTIGELRNDEVSELRDAAPELTPLLADTHPARAVVRNLFRLKRLSQRTDDERPVRTEIDMAVDWWRTADGSKDGRRERTRLLRTLAEQVLALEPLDAGDHPPPAVNALIASGTLRDLDSDRMTFSHDILRDWAVANVLFKNPRLVDSLPLERPAPAYLARGFELAARMRLERAKDDADWRRLLDEASRDGVHRSWRRTVLLAAVRSEIGIELLTRTVVSLLADNARLLIELIRTVKAVEVMPLPEYLANSGVTVPEAAAGLHIPSDPSWTRLMLWLLAVPDDDLPEGAQEDAAEFFLQAPWTGALEHPQLGGLLAHWFYRRLEGSDTSPSGRGASFNRLRAGFLVSCRGHPELAAGYLRSLMHCDVHDTAIGDVWKFSYHVVQAVPEELAELTFAVLTRTEGRSLYLRRQPFGSSDVAFAPPLPERGPFLALLDHAPAIGLKLIRQLLDHAIPERSQVHARDMDALTIHFADGERIFSRRDTYMWSRETGNGSSCIQSALMALEAWAHRRIEEKGEDVGVVLADVLPPAGGPAAYLLVAVDLILSHWPKSARAAVPLVACPELLCLDIERAVTDQLPIPDIMGLDHWVRTTHDMSGSDSLKARPSRQSSLDTLLGCYALSGLSEMRSDLVGLLKQAVERLGPYDQQANRSHPEFMAAHALNGLDPANWQQTSDIGPDGESVGAWKYVSPPEEMEHLARLEAAASPYMDDWSMRTAVQAAMRKGPSSPAFVTKALDWARRSHRSTVDFRDLAPIIAAAFIVMRDGEEDLRSQNREWAREVFLEALAAEANSISPNIDVQFNPVAMAFMGMVVHLMRENVEPPDLRALLEAACRADLLAVSGFRTVAVVFQNIDERLPRALLRTAFASCIHSQQEYPPAEDHTADRAERLRSVVDRELGWLFGEDDEPEWPKFPMAPSASLLDGRGPRRLGSSTADVECEEHSEPEEELYDSSAARWLDSVSGLFDVKARPWLRGLAQAYSEWTAIMNGSKLGQDDEVRNMPSEWNAAYYGLVAHCLPGLESEDIDRLALNPIRSLPDKPFFDATSRFLRSLDLVYFEKGSLAEAEAVRIRAVLAERLTECHHWRWRDRDPSASIEVTMGAAVAALFFNNWDRLPPSSCYILAPGIPRIDPFLPVLERLVAKGPNGFVAGLVLDLIEVSPMPAHLPFIAAVAETWRVAHPDDAVFWVDNGVARRLCAIIENVGTQEPYSSWRPRLRDRVGNILSALVALGVPLAGKVERDLADSGGE